jgi:hypothetical protein
MLARCPGNAHPGRAARQSRARSRKRSTRPRRRRRARCLTSSTTASSTGATPLPQAQPRGGDALARDAGSNLTCPVSTEGGTRRVQLVREGRGGGGGRMRVLRCCADPQRPPVGARSGTLWRSDATPVPRPSPRCRSCCALSLADVEAARSVESSLQARTPPKLHAATVHPP